jgi:hypothetical protein
MQLTAWLARCSAGDWNLVAYSSLSEHFVGDIAKDAVMLSTMPGHGNEPPDDDNENEDENEDDGGSSPPPPPGK